MVRTRVARRLSAAAAAVLLAAGCTTGGTAIPAPRTSGATVSSSTPSSAPSTSTAVAADGDDPALDRCDDLGILPCARQVAHLSLPIAGSAVTLTYSSDRAEGRLQDRAPSADRIGLGGWTLSNLDSYDPATATEITGAGRLRHVTGVPAGVAGAAAAAPSGQPAPHLAVADAGGTTVDLFDASGRAVAVTSATTGAVLERFGWGPRGLTSVADSTGVALTVLRDPSGTATAIVVTRGATTRLGTASGALAAVQYPDGSRALIGSNRGLVTDVADAAGTYTGFGYDGQGRVTSTRTGAGAATHFSRTISGHTLTVTTSLPTGGELLDSTAVTGSTTTWTRTGADGASASLAATGSSRTLTTADGTRSTLTLAPDPRWGLDAPVPATLTSGASTVAASGSAGPAAGQAGSAISRSLTVAGSTWTFRYRPDTRTATRTDPAGQTTTTRFDAQGRVVASATGSNISINYTYGPDGRVASTTLGSGAGARTWTYGYTGSTTTVTDPAGGVQQRTLTATGALAKVQGPGAQGMLISRDAAGRVTGFNAPGSGQYRLSWGGNGHLAAINAPAGQGGPQFTGFDYDASGQLIAQRTADTSLTFTRDSSGRVLTYDPGTGAVAAAYDSAGRLTTVTNADATVQTSYTGSAPTSESTTGVVKAAVSRTLDTAGRTASVTLAGSAPVTYQYDATGAVVAAGGLVLHRDAATGLVTSQTLGALTATFSRNQFGEIEREVVTGPAGAVVTDVDYTRDRLGRITGVVTAAGGRTTTAEYAYDPAGRLVHETNDGARTDYAYDQAGDLTGITAGGALTTLTYDSRHALISRGDTTYTYDGAGSLLTESSPAGTTHYRYDGAGRLLSVQRPGAPRFDAVLDGFGRRIATRTDGKLSGGLAYLDPLRPVARLDASGAVDQSYVYAGNAAMPTYLTAGGVHYLEVPDASGGPALALDARTGAVADRVVRSALGKVLSDSAPGFQPIGFAGGIVDPATGLVHLGARDYDPDSGRFTAPDPRGIGGGSANLYQYVGGDPVNRSDPSGQFCDYFSVGLSGTAVAGGVGGNVSVGLATSGTQLGGYASTGLAVGAGAGISVVFNCYDNLDQSKGPKLDDFGGGGNSVDVGVGPASAGWDVGYGSDGLPSSQGSHVGVGPSVGVSGSGSNTHVSCWFGCPDTPAGPSDDDVQQAIDHEANCGGMDAGLCDPNPSDPANGAPDDPADPGNICQGGGTCNTPDPANSGGSNAPPGNGARTTNDPHLRTADGVLYDFQAVGEFTWLRSDSGDLDVQVRQQPVPGSRFVSLTTAVALSVDSDRLLVVNPAQPGAPLTVTAAAPIPGAGSFTLPHGATVVRTSAGIVLTAKDGTKLWISANPKGLNVNAFLPDARHGRIHGLAGPFTGASTGVETSSGTPLTRQQLTDHDTLYRTFGDSWRIAQAASLFPDRAGDATAFDDPTFPDRNPPVISAAARSTATAICRQLQLSPDDLAGCILDVALTGDAGYASAMARDTGTVPGAAGSVQPAVTGDILPGQSVQGSVSAGGKKVYSFTAPAGTVAYFAAGAGCGQPTGGEVTWSVADATGSLIVGSALICSDVGRVVLPTAGRYQVVVTSASGAGAFTLTWRPSRPDLVRPLTPGATVSGSIDVPGAHDRYTVAVTAGEVGYLAAAPGCTTASAGPTLMWSVLDVSGDSYTGASDICSDIGRTLFTKPGNYQVVVVGVGPATGPYRISWRTSRPDRVLPLVAGQQVAGSIDEPGAHDRYTLAVTAGTVGYFAADPGCTHPAGAASGAGLTWYLLDVNGSSFTGSSDICADIGRVRFPQGGTYQLVVASGGGSTAPYRLSWLTSRPDAMLPLTLGGSVSGFVDKPGAEDLWAFTVDSPRTIHLTAAAGCAPSELIWSVRAADGTSISGSSGICDDVGAVTLPKAGTYQVEVGGTGAATGHYSFGSSG